MNGKDAAREAETEHFPPNGTCQCRGCGSGVAEDQRYGALAAAIGGSTPLDLRAQRLPEPEVERADRLAIDFGLLRISWFHAGRRAGDAADDARRLQVASQKDR